MTRLQFQAVVSKVLAIGIVSLLLAWCIHSFNAEQIQKMNTTSSADYLAYKRKIYQPSWTESYIGLFIFGSIYVLLVEAIAFAIRALLPKSFFRDETPTG